MKNKNRWYLAFLISFLIGLIIVLPNIIFGNGIFTLVADYNFQEIPFNMMVNRAIKSGNIFWTWYNDLGSNFIATFSFYNLLSPFNLFCYIFPAKWFMYFSGPMYAVKYGVAGLTSYLFLKRYVKNDKYAILGSILYSFSGYQFTNMLFYHFHDAVAFFPLLLYTLDNKMYDNKKGIFALVVALCAFTNWFFFVGEVIFVIIYFFIKLILKEYKITVRDFVGLVMEAISGTLISMVILCPTMLFTISNPRVDGTWVSLKQMLFYQLPDYIRILKSFIWPSEAMTYYSLLSSSNFSSCEAYLPFVGIVFVINYIKRKPKNWISILLYLMILFAFVPVLNSSFILFNTTYYARWFFILTLLFSLATIKSLDENDNSNDGVMISLFVFSLILFLLFLYYRKYGMEFIIDSKKVVLSISLMIINLVIVYFINKSNNSARRYKYLITFVILFASLWGNYTIYNYKNKTFKNNSVLIDFYKDDDKFTKYSNYRTNSTSTSLYNYGYTSSLNNLYSWNSNINGSAFEFYNSIDVNRGVSTIIDVDNKLLNDYLGVKYVFSNSEDISYLGYKYVETIDGVKVYENPNSKEFGFSVNNYISKKDFANLSSEEKIQKLNDSIVLNNNQISKYSNLFNQDLKNKTYEVLESNFVKNGFNSIIKSDYKTIAIYQIPYDSGWKVTNNGKNVEVLNIDHGMIGIEIEEGENNIKFEYETPGLKVGIILSVCGIVMLIGYCLIEKGGKNAKK